jgi:hypothetical protein
VLWILTAVLVIPAIYSGGFWWTDETRHAMGGVFILDFVRDMPIADPMGYAMQYFAQYPALALNWYLPGFYAVEAVFYAVFGISEQVAHWSVFLFSVLAASVWFAWSRRTWGTLAAFLATALLLSVPTWSFWARSVMLEVPAIGIFLLSILFFEQYLDKPTYWRSVTVGLIMAAAILFKQTVTVLLPAVLIYGALSQRRSALLSWKAAPAYIFVFIALVITVVHATKFGGQGLAVTVGDGAALTGVAVTRFSFERWILYPSMLLQTWGWHLLVLSAIGALWPSQRNELQLPLLRIWFVFWYVSFSLLFGSASVENAGRYTLYVFPALAMLAARPVFLLQKHMLARSMIVALLCTIFAWNVWSTFQQKVRYVDGYREAAEYIHKKQTLSPILFAGKYDGSFIFHLRELNIARNDVVLRAEKILVSMAVIKNFGMVSHVATLEDIMILIKRYNIEYILIEQPDIVDIKEFRMLYELVQNPAFEKLSVFPVSSGGIVRAPERIEIYRFKNHTHGGNAEIVIPLPHMGREIRFTTKYH